MRRIGVFILFLFLVLGFSVFADAVSSDIDSEMQKLTHYAEEYEVGNIDYVQLMIHVSSVRESMNRILGVTNRDLGGVVKQGDIENVLGKPNEETRWVWVEGEDHDVRLDEAVPVWRRIVFDGKKIQIRMEAHPSIFKKKKFENGEEKKFSGIEDGALIYRLNFNTQFKKPKDQLDVEAKISEIKSLAEKFNEDPSNSNAKVLAKESVNAEKVFQNYFQQAQTNCEEFMKKLFGSENQRQSQKILLNEISIFEGENFEAIMRLEMCDECEFNWINLNMRFEGKMNFDSQKREGGLEQSKEKYVGMSDSEFEVEVKRLFDEILVKLESGEMVEANRLVWELNILNNAWNENANNVWEKVRMDFEKEMSSMSDEERYEFDQNYGWIKQDQKQRKVVRELQKENYEKRKDFYLNLFSGYYKKEFYFTQMEFERRLVEEFKVMGEEICSNNVDDNENEQVDCEDSQCGGKVCGKGTQTIVDENESLDVEVDFYCIQQVCQAREEINETSESVCGNHICEENERDSEMENGTCQMDCTFEDCPVYEAVKCSGKVIFEGEDEMGCVLAPICIEEKMECLVNEDCVQPSCGVAECVIEGFLEDVGVCKITELVGCEAECESWEQDIEVCGDGKKIVSKICEYGRWKDSGVVCESDGVECMKCGNSCMPESESAAATCEESTDAFYCDDRDGDCVRMEFEETIAGDECVMIGDCGGEDDICSNGKCVSIPKVIREGDEEAEVEVEGVVEEENIVEEKEVNVVEEIVAGVSGFLLKGFGTITGNVVGEGESPSVSEPVQEEVIEVETVERDEEQKEPEVRDEGFQEEPKNDFAGDERRQEDEEGERQDERNEDEQRRREEEQKQREEENRERCAKDCERPCVQKCIRDTCGDEMNCDVDVESAVCEKSCVASEDCIGKCMSGEPDWWKEFEEEDAHKQEKGVFQVGGGCRKEKGETQGHIWFGGWGDPFGRVDGLKQEFYSGGEADWCKQDLENLVKQRKEFEKSFNLEFAEWFFEKYLTNSANEWKQAQNGIYEVYWNNVDMQRQFAERMKCVGEDDVRDVINITLISFEYETEFGKLEYWEEIRSVKMDQKDEEVTIVSPYMKIWIFPSEEFIKYEMQQSMANGEFPGSPEEKAERENEEGFTEDEKMRIRDDEESMGLINDVTEKYGGNADVVLRVMDEGEVVFNLYIEVNKDDIVKMKPMAPDGVPAEDIRIEVEWERLYDLISFEEENMRGTELESPPWDERPRQGAVKGFTDGVRMYLKVRGLINSAVISPESDEGEVRDFIMSLIRMKGGEEDDMGDEGMKEEGVDVSGQSGMMDEK